MWHRWALSKWLHNWPGSACAISQLGLVHPSAPASRLELASDSLALLFETSPSSNLIIPSDLVGLDISRGWFDTVILYFKASCRLPAFAHILSLRSLLSPSTRSCFFPSLPDIRALCQRSPPSLYLSWSLYFSIIFTSCSSSYPPLFLRLLGVVCASLHHPWQLRHPNSCHFVLI